MQHQSIEAKTKHQEFGEIVNKKYFPIKSLFFTKRIVHLEKCFLYLSNNRKEEKKTSTQKKHDETLRQHPWL